MAKLKKNTVIHPFGPASNIDNSNITDNIAVYLLESGKATEEDFEELPAEKKKTVKNDKNK